MYGVSIFLNEGSPEIWESYLQEMSQAGAAGIFTSLHIPEDDPAVYQERLKALGGLAKKYQMELVADVSPKSLSYLGYDWETAAGLIRWGVTGLRVDYGIEEEIIAQLSHVMKVALNASTMTEASIQHMKSLGGNLNQMEAWHNYYPRPETGLDLEGFNKKNQWLHQLGIGVMAFVPGEETLRAPLYERLPTLEKHRYSSSFSAFIELAHNEWVDHIYIGDPGLGAKTMEQLKHYHQDNTFLLEAKPAVENRGLLGLLNSGHTNRMDAARDVIRSQESRGYALPGSQSVEPENTAARPKGSITIDNELYGRYQGEVQITKVDLPADTRVNVLGQIHEKDIQLLDYIGGGTAFRFQLSDNRSR
ncbi:DUF871 domain-containing protein [Oceanobacillus sp. CFH 90083]|uniref:DUF871 domain-containing protein n=1 Tax=Oceanobacillus sp. CFH 90083 TaxID=2592336 RepID=UPI00128E2CE6|nr:MupG family TIM beta-alpha barrel fold protein [Oceanobacillus sp. CFH 90083]